MVEVPENAPGSVPVPVGGMFCGGRLLIWIASCAVLGLLVARAAEVAASHFAPIVLFPLMVGAILGGTLVLAMRAFHVGHRPTIWLGGLLAVLVVIAGQHYFSFQNEQRQWEGDPEKLAKIQLVAPERIPPAGFWQYMRWSAARGRPIGTYTARGGLAWLAWSLDALLVLLPALTLVVATARMPYCNACRRWFRTIRSGPLLHDTAALLAGYVGAELPLAVRKGRYRLLACQGGCGPTGLTLSWDDPDGQFRSGTTWLDAQRRRQVVEILDQSSLRDAQEDASTREDGGPIADREKPIAG